MLAEQALRCHELAKKKRAYTDTTVPYVPADPLKIMGALLNTPPPPAGEKSTRKAKPKKKRAKRKGR